MAFNGDYQQLAATLIAQDTVLLLLLLLLLLLFHPLLECTSVEPIFSIFNY